MYISCPPRYKTVVKLMSEDSCATDPTNINMTDYSSLESTDGDYTDPGSSDDQYFLFNNVRKLPRRKRRKIPQNLKNMKKRREKKKVEYSSESNSESGSDEVEPRRRRSSSCRRFRPSNNLSDMSEDEDAIHFNVLRDFARMENAQRGSLQTSSFSASACQQIHSELLESVNQLYQDMKRKPLLKRNAISTSSISHSKYSQG